MNRLPRIIANAVRERFAPWIVQDDNGTDRAEWTKAEARDWLNYTTGGRVFNVYTGESL